MSGILGLDYEDSPVDGGSPAQEPAPAVASTGLLTIVDYTDTDEVPAVERPDLGVSLDDDAIVHGAPRKLGSVQVSVVKRSSVTTPAGGEVSAPAYEAGTVAGPSCPTFVVPDSPPGEPHPKLMEKYAGYVAASKKGTYVNDTIRHAKRFRNPDLLEKLVSFTDVAEFGSNYPTDIYDPSACAARLTHVLANCPSMRTTAWTPAPCADG